MAKLQDVYNARVAAMGDAAQLAHVGHAHGGVPLTPEQMARMVREIRAALAPPPDAHVLDLCCGNGVFAQALSDHVGSVTGVDFSSELIRIATAQNSGPNIRYLQGDVSRLAEIPGLDDRRYDRVMMNASLQHFAPRNFGGLLDRILALCGPAPVLLFSYVAEHGKERALFDTPRKRLRRAWLRASGQDIFGHWWRRPEIAGPARARGLTCSFPEIDPDLPYAAYRMTARLHADGEGRQRG